MRQAIGWVRGNLERYGLVDLGDTSYTYFYRLSDEGLVRSYESHEIAVIKILIRAWNNGQLISL